jgi:hypothetical protein
VQRRTIVKKLLSSMLAVTVLLGAVSLCRAQESKPLVTVSFAGYDKLLADLGMIGKLGGNANLTKQLEMMSLMLPQGEGSKGPLALDTKLPWGAVLVTDGKTPSSYAFVPVTDIKPLMELAKAQSGHDIKAEKGVYQFPVSGKTMYAAQKGNWAFVADSPEQLAKVVTDPAPMLGDLPKKYDLAIRASVKNLPKEYREQLLAQLRAGAEVGMQQMANAGDEDAAMRANLAKQSVEQLTTLVNDMDELLLGWNIDSKTKTTYLDLELTAQTGTKLAAQLAEIKPGKSAFGGLLLPNAAVTASTVGTIEDAEVAQIKSALATMRKSAVKGLENQGLTEDEVKLASQLLGDMIDVFEKTVEAKNTDAALSLMLDPAAVTVVAGVKIAEGAKLDKTFQKLVEEVKKNEEAAKAFKLSDETVQGVHLHIISVPTPDVQMAPLVGDTLEVALGIADDKVLVAAGRDAAKTLKKAVGQLKTASDKEVSPLQIALSVTSIAKFVAEVGDDAQVKATASMVAGMLGRAGSKDHVTITAQPIAQGVRLRLELEEGLLKALGSMSQMMGGMAPAGGSK